MVVLLEIPATVSTVSSGSLTVAVSRVVWDGFPVPIATRNISFRHTSGTRTTLAINVRVDADPDRQYWAEVTGYSRTGEVHVLAVAGADFIVPGVAIALNAVPALTCCGAAGAGR